MLEFYATFQINLRLVIFSACVTHHLLILMNNSYVFFLARVLSLSDSGPLLRTYLMKSSQEDKNRAKKIKYHAGKSTNIFDALSRNPIEIKFFKIVSDPNKNKV